MLLGGGLQLVRLVVVAHVFGHRAIDRRAERFHQVVGQAEGVVTVMVVDAQRRVQAGGADGPRHDRPQNRVAVIQQHVLVFVFAVAAEIKVGEHMGPIAAGGVGLDVARVAGMDAAGHRLDAEIHAAQLDQQGGLGVDLRPDDLPPEPFSDGQGARAWAAKRSAWA